MVVQKTVVPFLTYLCISFAGNQRMNPYPLVSGNSSTSSYDPDHLIAACCGSVQTPDGHN